MSGPVQVDRELFARAVLAKLAWVAGVLVTCGWPMLAAWWLEVYTRFLTSPCRQLVARVGRRGGKSSWICLFAVAFVLVYAGLGLVPPGDVGWVVFVSVSKEEAALRLRTIRTILDAISVKYVPDGDTLIIAGTNVGFRVQAATIASVSGWTSILVVADEVSKWRDREGLNPATQVLEALRPTMAGQPLSLSLLLSSALGNEDAHAKAFDRGDDAFQMIAFAETWIARPSLSEQDTHGFEPDERVWRREYAGVPQGSASAAFDHESVIAAFEPLDLDQVVSNAVVGLDPAGRGKDRYGVCGGSWGMPRRDPDEGYVIEKLYAADGSDSGAVVVHRELPRLKVDPPTPKLCLFAFRGIDAKYRAGLGIKGIVDGIVSLAREIGATKAVTDGSEAFSLEGLLEEHGLKTTVFSFGGGNGVRTVSRMRQLFNARSIYIEADESVKQQFLNFEEKIDANGIHFRQGRDGQGHHYDDVSAALQVVRADLEGHLSGSPGGGSGGGMWRLNRRTGQWESV